MRVGDVRTEQWVAVGIGLAIGVATVSTVGYLDERLWQVWAALAVGLTTASGLVFNYGIARWRELPEAERVGGRRDAVVLAALVGGLLVVALVPGFLRRESHWRGPALVATAFAGLVPAACTMLAVRRAARSPEVSGDGELADWLLRRRRLLRGLLSAAGVPIALATLALGAAVQLQSDMVDAHRLEAAQAFAPQTVVIFGGSCSLVVALFYVPAVGELRQRARELCARLFDLTQVNDGPALLSRIDDRIKSEMLLGADTGLFADLQTGLVVLAPLLASTASLLLPH
ncbi:hypothetical protein ACFYXF_00395 [Streptomyces sp. NPDC002680]|uniref:hypothetical protein n=1 Tax=Streptomyces sp. NPDC002680 TaxID=3364659 RepID=UPI0036C84040